MVEFLLGSIALISLLGLLEGAYYSVAYLHEKKALNRLRLARRQAHRPL